MENEALLHEAMLDSVKHWTPKLHDANQTIRTSAELMITGIFVQYMLIVAPVENLRNMLAEIREHDAYLEYQLGRLMGAWFADVARNGSLVGSLPDA